MVSQIHAHVHTDTASISILRCRRVQLALTRALLVLQDASRREITRDWERRERVFRYYLAIGKEIPERAKANISRKNNAVIVDM